MNARAYWSALEPKRRCLIPGDLVKTVGFVELRPFQRSFEMRRVIVPSDVCIVITLEKADRSKQQCFVINQMGVTGWLFQSELDRLVRAPVT